MTMMLDGGSVQRADVRLAAASLPRTVRTLQDGRSDGSMHCCVHCIGTGFTA